MNFQEQGTQAEVENVIDNNIIQSVGVELEGGCNNEELEKIKCEFPSVECALDGSVAVKGKEIPNCELRYWSENIGEVWDFVRCCFREGYVQNCSCGNHVHLKINPDVVGIFTTEEFNGQIVRWYRETYEENEKYIGRFAGGWAKPGYNLERVMRVLSTIDKNNRFYFVNCNSYLMHGTIEFRIMPWMTSADEYIGNISVMLRRVIEIVNSIKTDGEYVMPAISLSKDCSKEQSIAKTKLHKKIMINRGIRCV